MQNWGQSSVSELGEKRVSTPIYAGCLKLMPSPRKTAFNVRVFHRNHILTGPLKNNNKYKNKFFNIQELCTVFT